MQDQQVASFALIEAVRAADLKEEHIGRPVSFPYRDARVHGTLVRSERMPDGDVYVTLAGAVYYLPPETCVSVIIRTHAEGVAQ